MKFSGKNPALRVAAKRYAQCYDDNRQTETIKNDLDKCV